MKFEDILGERIYIDNLYGRDKEGIFISNRFQIDFYQPLFNPLREERINGISIYTGVEPSFEYRGKVDNMHIFRGMFRYNKMNIVEPSLKEEYGRAIRALTDAGFIFNNL